MWCKGLKVMGNEQPDHRDNHQSPCVGGPWSWYKPILFSKQKPKTPKIQHSAHRRSAVGYAYNHHPFLKRDFLCRKWFFCGNASNPCNHVNPFPALMVEMSVLQLGGFLVAPAKKSKQEQSNSVSADMYSDRHSHCPGTAIFIYYGKKTLRHKAVAGARIQVLHSSSSFMALPLAHAVFALGQLHLGTFCRLAGQKIKLIA